MDDTLLATLLQKAESIGPQPLPEVTEQGMPLPSSWLGKGLRAGVGAAKLAPEATERLVGAVNKLPRMLHPRQMYGNLADSAGSDLMELMKAKAISKGIGLAKDEYNGGFPNVKQAWEQLLTGDILR